MIADTKKETETMEIGDDIILAAAKSVKYFDGENGYLAYDDMSETSKQEAQKDIKTILSTAFALIKEKMLPLAEKTRKIQGFGSFSEECKLEREFEEVMGRLDKAITDSATFDPSERRWIPAERGMTDEFRKKKLLTPRTAICRLDFMHRTPDEGYRSESWEYAMLYLLKDEQKEEIAQLVKEAV
jgi:hypothetical protein